MFQEAIELLNYDINKRYKKSMKRRKKNQQISKRIKQNQTELKSTEQVLKGPVKYTKQSK